MMPIIIRSDASLDKFKALANLLDTAFRVPGTKIRFGFDAILGLIPVVGDVIGTLLGGYIVQSAASFGVPRVVQLRMMLNLWIDMVIGLIPFAGDFFDIGWKANTRNVALMEQAMMDPEGAKRSSRRVLVGLTLASVAALALVVFLITWAIRSI
ncbi:MAG: DUF4112 domain-containing protein [Planctomycetes bacterium]|nr:DUF4112 domain-containing protein [Planctomycetota bacterium]